MEAMHAFGTNNTFTSLDTIRLDFIDNARVETLAGDVVERITEMKFYSPEGSSWQDQHRLLEKEGQFETTSFDLKDGEWVKRRSYTWRAEKRTSRGL